MRQGTNLRGRWNHSRCERIASQRRAGRRAFTLIELLVVVAVIAILAALLLPALGRAKARTRTTVCLNKQRQWALALMMYADDHDGEIPRESYLPGGTVVNIWVNIQSALSRNVWYNALPPEMKVDSAVHYGPSSFTPDFYDRANMFHCPEAAFPAHAELDATVFFSIAMNSKLILIPNSTMRLGAIQRPSDTVIFLDNRLPGEPKVHPAQPNDNLGQPSAYASRFVARHRGRGVLAFADGHVENLPGHDVVTNGFAHYPQTKIAWTADPNVDPDLVQ
jgi:prepilin-type N-terminal cleavage/methylation domain-containing protein/prepilin-type processing-associated H-X9-DG protein